MINVSIYARSATISQAGDNSSIPNQIAECKRYARKHRWRVKRVFDEIGSGVTDKRPMFQQMITESCGDPKPWDLILIRGASRFARDVVLFEYYRRKLKARGIVIHCVDDEASVMSGMDESHREQLSSAINHAFGLFQRQQHSLAIKRGIAARKLRKASGA